MSVTHILMQHSQAGGQVKYMHNVRIVSNANGDSKWQVRRHVKAEGRNWTHGDSPLDSQPASAACFCMLLPIAGRCGGHGYGWELF